MTETFFLFVYGTLMSDGCRAGVLAGQGFLGTHRTQPCYRLLDLGPYPGLIRRDPGRSIEGELFEIDSELRAQLDRIEAAPSLFRLEEVELAGHPGPVWTYLYQRGGPETPVYPDCRWHNRGRSSEAEDDDD
jgi:gamma-glutamylaminecyclotransferase